MHRVGPISTSLTKLYRAEHVLLFNRVKPSRALVVVAGVADHPDWIFRKVNSPLASSDFNHALKQSQFTLQRIALADLQAIVTVAGKI